MPLRGVATLLAVLAVLGATAIILSQSVSPSVHACPIRASDLLFSLLPSSVALDRAGVRGI